MIKLSLINGKFSLLDGDLNLERLLHEHQDDVMLSCNEPRYKMGGILEQAAANYLSSLLPFGYTTRWDESAVGYSIRKNKKRELPPIIKELRFKVLLQKW